MMSGRTLFKYYKPLMKILLKVLELFPRVIFEQTWWAVRCLPGKIGVGARYIYAKRLCKKCGDNVLIGKDVIIKNWHNLEVGSNVSIWEWCFLDAIGIIRIGNNVSIAHSTSILSFEHSWLDEEIPIKYNKLLLRTVIIQSDVWIGCAVRILAGSEIGSRTIVAAGTIVNNKKIEKGVYGGVPVKLLKKIAHAD